MLHQKRNLKMVPLSRIQPELTSSLPLRRAKRGEEEALWVTSADHQQIGDLSPAMGL